MPVGIIADALCVISGAALGFAAGGRMSEDIKSKLNIVFGIAALSMGIVSIPLLKNLPAVVLSVIAGSLAGFLLKLGRSVSSVAGCLLKGKATEEFITAAVLFCVSGTGYYGSLCEGMTGDSSILLAKAIMDFFTAMVFACRLDKKVELLGIPQFVIHMIIFLIAGWVYPLCSASMVADFKACGGIIMLATGLRMLGIVDAPVVEMIPSIIIVMPVSYWWSTYILPLL